MTAPAPNPFSLSGRVALVTGSTTGLGKAMAMALGRAGAKVALNFSNNVGRKKRLPSSKRRVGRACWCVVT